MNKVTLLYSDWTCFAGLYCFILSSLIYCSFGRKKIWTYGSCLISSQLIDPPTSVLSQLADFELNSFTSPFTQEVFPGDVSLGRPTCKACNWVLQLSHGALPCRDPILRAIQWVFSSYCYHCIMCILCFWLTSDNPAFPFSSSSPASAFCVVHTNTLSGPQTHLHCFLSHHRFSSSPI